MTEQEIKAWSLSIAVQIKGQGLPLSDYEELANEIAANIRNVQPLGKPIFG